MLMVNKSRSMISSVLMSQTFQDVWDKFTRNDVFPPLPCIHPPGAIRFLFLTNIYPGAVGLIIQGIYLALLFIQSREEEHLIKHPSVSPYLLLIVGLLIFFCFLSSFVAGRPE